MSDIQNGLSFIQSLFAIRFACLKPKFFLALSKVDFVLMLRPFCWKRGQRLAKQMKKLNSRCKNI